MRNPRRKESVHVQALVFVSIFTNTSAFVVHPTFGKFGNGDILKSSDVQICGKQFDAKVLYSGLRQHRSGRSMHKNDVGIAAMHEDFAQFRSQISECRLSAMDKLRAVVDEKTSTGRLQTDWIVFNQSAVLGRGAYGTVVEARLIAGPWSGLRLVAKRALDGKMDPPVIPSGAASIFGNSQTDSFLKTENVEEEELKRAAEYLDVEAKLNAMVTRACPAIAAPYLGDVLSDGRRWLLWELISRQTLEDVLEDADWVGNVSPLAEALGVSERGERAAVLVAQAVATQLLEACRALQAAGICELPLPPSFQGTCRNALSSGSVLYVSRSSVLFLAGTGVRLELTATVMT
jgi:hypothetical protein